MNAKQSLFPIFFLLLLSGCVSPEPYQSSSESASMTSASQSTSESSATVSSFSSSDVSSLSSEDSLDFYLSRFSNDAIYTSVRRTLNVSKEGVVYKNGYDYRIYDGNNAIEHAFGSESVVAGLPDNDDKVTSAYDIYRTQDLVYAKGYDGKYQVSAPSEAPHLGQYALPYHLAYATALSLSYVSFTAVINGAVMKESLVSFLNDASTDLSGIDDFTFSCVYSQSEGEVESLAFAYTQDAYQVKINYAVSSQKETLTLPIV